MHEAKYGGDSEKADHLCVVCSLVYTGGIRLPLQVGRQGQGVLDRQVLLRFILRDTNL